MTRPRAVQMNMSRGELAPHLYGRWDVDTWSAALKTARNVVVMKYGGVTKCPGTFLVSEVLDRDNPVRLIPFEFSIEQAYVLEFGHGYAAPIAFGGRVLEEELNITGISNAHHAEVTAEFHAYTTGDLVYLSGIEGTMGDLLNGRFWTVVASTGTNTFTIDADTTGVDPFTSAAGGVTRSEEPDPPPAPPPVPPPDPDPEPPSTGGGGGFCVTDDTPILLASGEEIPAAHLIEGMMVRTQHEHTLEWGDYRVSAVSFSDEAVYACFFGDSTIRATGDHRFYVDGRWWHAKHLGAPAGIARVAKITVEDAHTYVSNGVLSHNIKSGIIGGDI